MTGPRPLRGPGLAFAATVYLQDSTPPVEVPEQFYQARKKLGDAARTATVGNWCR